MVSYRVFSMLLLAGAISCSAQSGRRNIDDFHPITVIFKPFPAITKIPTISVKDAAGKIGGSELVLGVVVGKEARAYPINMLTGPRREILNDNLGGKAIAATW